MPRLDDGHATTYSFAKYPGVKLYEKEITPPGMSGGGGNNTTTLRNVRFRTMAPKKLKTLTNSTFVAAYDPAVYIELFNMIQDKQLITITFPPPVNKQFRFWGWLDEFQPNRIVEGEQPTAQCTVIPSMDNDQQVETDPVYV